MIAITLSADQIRTAPLEVRHWIEQQISMSLAPPPAEVAHQGPHLTVCTGQEVIAIFRQIQNLLPVVNLFFELGRESAAAQRPGMRVFRMADLLRHTRLGSADQAVECLEVISDVLRRVRSDPEAMLCAVDRQGTCYVAEETAANIFALWQDVVAARAVPPDVERTPMRADAG